MEPCVKMGFSVQIWVNGFFIPCSCLPCCFLRIWSRILKVGKALQVSFWLSLQNYSPGSLAELFCYCPHSFLTGAGKPLGETTSHCQPHLCWGGLLSPSDTGGSLLPYLTRRAKSSMLSGKLLHMNIIKRWLFWPRGNVNATQSTKYHISPWQAFWYIGRSPCLELGLTVFT